MQDFQLSFYPKKLHSSITVFTVSKTSFETSVRTTILAFALTIRRRFKKNREKIISSIPTFFAGDILFSIRENNKKYIFASYSMLFLSRFHANMAARVSSWICCDHTFNSAANIGFSQEGDGRWVRLFSSIFCVLGIMEMSYTGDLLVENRSMKFLTSLKTRTNAISLLDVMLNV